MVVIVVIIVPPFLHSLLTKGKITTLERSPAKAPAPGQPYWDGAAQPRCGSRVPRNPTWRVRGLSK